jgi:hypothetical protein
MEESEAERFHARALGRSNTDRSRAVLRGAVVSDRPHHAGRTGMDAIPKDLRLLLAGGASGAMTYTLIAPLERTKILLQVQGMRASTKYTGIGQTILTVVREEGFLALYKASNLSSLSVADALRATSQMSHA